MFSDSSSCKKTGFRLGEVHYFLFNHQTDQKSFMLVKIAKKKMDKPWLKDNRLDFPFVIKLHCYFISAEDVPILLHNTVDMTQRVQHTTCTLRKNLCTQYLGQKWVPS